MKRHKSTLLLKAAFLVAYFFIFIISANGQLQWLNPKPSGFNNLKILFTNHQNGFVLNMNNDLFETTDTGESWEHLTRFPEGSNAIDIKDSTGVVTGHYGMIYLSTDNGYSWDALNTGIDNYFEFVQVVSRDTFFITGGDQKGYGKLYRTDDRGKTWTNLNCNLPIRSVNFVDSKTGYIGSSQGKLLKTVDGGVTWEQKKVASRIPSGINAIQFLDKDTGFVFQQPDLLCRTYDGGNTWEETVSLQSNIYAMHFLNSTDGYLAGEYGSISGTHDGGKTLEYISFDSRDGNRLNSVYFLSRDTGFVIGLSGRIMKTTNAGKNWVSYNPTHSTVTGLSVADSANVFFITASEVFQTTDKGQSWKPAALSIGGYGVNNKNFENIHFFNPDTGFITSRKPLLIHHTFDGGKTWDATKLSSKNGDTYRNLQFIDSKTGFMTEQDEYGSNWFLKTSDGGVTWQDKVPNSQRGFRKVQFLTVDTVYAHSYYNLYQSTDGGENWTIIKSVSTSITSFYYITSDIGFFTTSEGFIYSTKDGGMSWRQVRIFDFSEMTGDDIKDIRFLDKNVGFLTNRDVFQTIDGGETWRKMMNRGGNEILITPDSTLYVYGGGGAIMGSKIKNIRVDSLNLSNSCANELSAVVTSVFSRADSVSFEITNLSGRVVSIAATPSSVENASSRVTATINLFPDSNYSVKLKYWSDNKFFFSEPARIKGKGLPAPVIQVEGNMLISTTSNNQWYKNDTLIAGADQSEYTITPQYYKQCFKVSHTTDNGCVIFSDPICFDLKPVIPLIINGAFLENEILLTWNAVAEANIHHFEVVKSKNGYEYETLARVPVNSSPLEQTYTYRDPALLTANSQSHYYMVVKVYQDSTSVRSNSVRIEIPGMEEKVVVAAPNPTSGKTILHFPETISHATILVYDQFGKKVHSEQVTSPGKKYEINLVGLKPGIYTIRIVTNEKSLKLKIVILK